MRRIYLAITLVCLTPTAAAAQCYVKAPPLVTGLLDQVIPRWKHESNAAVILSQQLSTLALLDALVGLGDTQAAVPLFETADTSKQLGASSRGGGSTSIVDRPGIAKFLALALENGALSRKQDGTRLTLSSSPYALFAWAQGDNDETYRTFDFFTRLGFSAGFDVDSPDQPIEDLDAGQLREVSARFRFTPDRGPRSQEFERFWNQEVRAAVTADLQALVTAASGLSAHADFLGLRRAFETELATRTAGQTEEGALRATILCVTEEYLVIPVRRNLATLQAQHGSSARVFVTGITAAQAGLASAKQRIDKYLAAVGDKPQATLAMSHHRPVAATPFTDLALIYEQKTFSPFKLILNAGGAFYHGPDAAKHQESVKDLSFSAALEWARPSPFLAGSAGLDRATITLAARFERAREKEGVLQKRPTFGVFQARVDLPVSTGVTIPISFSVSNTGEAVSGEKKRWQRGLHFGLTFDSDKLLALARSRALALAGQ